MPEGRPGLRNLSYALIIAAAALGVVTLRLNFQGLPRAGAEGAPMREFSSARALEYLSFIAREPHPAGSAHHRRVRAYIVDALRSLGCRVSAQKATAARALFPNLHAAGRVHNIAALLPGARPTGAVLFMGHYDSVPSGPGAADDGFAVAAMLETIRVLKTGPPLRNDIIFLFTDAEEFGLLGAHTFLEGHPWRKRARLVVNLEARGTGGPAILFQTGPANGRVVSEFIEASPSPVGSSLSNAVYAFLPNDTDFTLFREAGYRGLNFANIGGVTAYHTALDNIDRVDPRSLQHHGSHVLALARHFGGRELYGIDGPDAVYFNIIGGWMASYSERAASLFSLAVLILLAVVLVHGFRKKLLSPGRVAKSFGLWAAFFAAVPLAAHAAWRTVTLVHSGYGAMLMGEIYNSGPYRVAFAALAVMLSAVAVERMRRNASLPEALAAGLVWWALLLAASTAFLPGASHLFLWPAFFGLLQLGALFRMKTPSPLRTVLVLLLSVPAILLLADTAHYVYEGLTVRLAAVAAFLIALFCPLLSPLLASLEEYGGRFTAAVSAAVFVAALAAGSLTAGFDAARPRPDLAAYVLDADSGHALWVSCDGEADPWTKQFFPSPRHAPLPDLFPIAKKCMLKDHAFLSAPAPRVPFAAPWISELSDTGERPRILRLRVRSARGAPSVALYIANNGLIRDLAIDGKRLRAMSLESLKAAHRLIFGEFDLSRWTVVLFHALPAGGVELRIDMERRAPLEIRAVDITDGLPMLERLGYRPRPADTMISPDFFLREGVMVKKRYVF